MKDHERRRRLGSLFCRNLSFRYFRRGLDDRRWRRFKHLLNAAGRDSSRIECASQGALQKGRAAVCEGADEVDVFEGGKRMREIASKLEKTTTGGVEGQSRGFQNGEAVGALEERERG